MSQIKDGDEAIGNRVKVKVVKNGGTPSGMQNSISYLEKEYPRSARYWIWV